MKCWERKLWLLNYSTTIKSVSFTWRLLLYPPFMIEMCLKSKKIVNRSVTLSPYVSSVILLRKIPATAGHTSPDGLNDVLLSETALPHGIDISICAKSFSVVYFIFPPIYPIYSFAPYISKSSVIIPACVSLLSGKEEVSVTLSEALPIFRLNSFLSEHRTIALSTLNIHT